MIKGSLVPWIVLGCTALFLAGFFTCKLLNNNIGPAAEEPNYLERLTRTLNLSDDQQQKISGLFADEDAMIREVLGNEHSEALRRSFQEIREQIEGEILKVLTPEQRKVFSGMAPESPPSPLPGG